MSYSQTITSRHQDMGVLGSRGNRDEPVTNHTVARMTWSPRFWPRDMTAKLALARRDARRWRNGRPPQLFVSL